jgi:hypothetical protein
MRHSGRQRTVTLHIDPDRIPVQVFPLGRGPLSFGHLGESVGFRPFLHEQNKWLGPVGGVQGEQAKPALPDTCGDTRGVVIGERGIPFV